jgi:SAM-dependent methyltransferase
MNRDLWKSWADKQAEQLASAPWLLSKWETIAGVDWPEPKISLMISDLKSKLSLHPSHWLLDLGCGPGWIAERLAPSVRKTVAIDFSPSMLRNAARRPGFIPVLADASALPLPPSSFHRIMIYFMLMNVTDRKTIFVILREALRALAPGGKLLAGQMPLSSRSAVYDQEKARYLEYCRERFRLGPDLAKDHAPPIVLFEDDFDRVLARELHVPVKIFGSFNHFWREDEPTQCSWRVDYLLTKE